MNDQSDATEVYLDERLAKGFISFNDYKNFEAYKEYVKSQESSESKQEVVAKEAELKKVNPASILTIILGIGFVIWCLIASMTMKTDSLYCLYLEYDLIGLITKTLNASSDIYETIITTCMLVTAIIVVVMIIFSIANVTSRRGNKVFTAFGSIAFILNLAAGVIILVIESPVKLGLIITLVVSFLIFFVNIIGRQNKKLEEKDATKVK